MQSEDKSREAGRKLIVENLFPLAAFQRMAWHMVLSPAWILVTLFPMIGLITGILKPDLQLPLAMNILVFGMRTVIWGAVLILALPPVARWCLQRNIPFLAAYLGLLFTCFIVMNLTSVFMLDGAHPGILILRLVRQIIFGATLSAILILIIEKDIRSLGSDPALVPVWWPVRPQMEAHPQGQVSPAADISLLDPALSGAVISLQAQNQYVEVVTSERTHMVRMPFHAALAKMPSAAGHRVHRSWWLANDVPIALEKNGQNHEARDAAGRVYPVSRPNLDLVRSLVERNTAPGTDATGIEATGTEETGRA